MMKMMFSLFVTLCLVVLHHPTSFLVEGQQQHATQRSYYEILGISKDANLKDIKKAYRKLALEYHPDRVQGNEATIEAATNAFREINEAYEVLSDTKQRQAYDEDLKWGQSHGGGGAGSGGSGGRPWGGFDWAQRRHHRHGGFRDPFEQFQDLFNHDPFFKDAFGDIDELFASTFFDDGGNVKNEKPKQQRDSQHQASEKKSWPLRGMEKMLGMLGGNLQVHAKTSNGPNSRGSGSSSSYSYSSYSSSSSSSSSSSINGKPFSRTSTSKSSRTYIDNNGKKVTVRSMEKDGNKIEEKYVNDKLEQRWINGVKDPKLLTQGDSSNKKNENISEF